MRSLGRCGLIVLSLLALSLPAASLCEAMGEWMGDCEVSMSQEMSHHMADCGGDVAISAGCCGETADSLADAVLSRPSDEDGLDAAAAYAQAAGSVQAQPSASMPPDAVPRGRPPRHQLQTTLLL